MDPRELEGMDEELKEDYVRQMIYGDGQHGQDRSGEDGGGEDGGGEDFSSQFLNESGEGAELQLMIDHDEVPLTNSGGEVCIYIKSLLITRCIN